MQGLFKDKMLNKQFREDGFVVIPFITTKQLSALKECFAKQYQNASPLSSEFFYSLLANNASESIKLKYEIENILKASYEKYFEHYRSVSESFLAKPYTVEPMQLHQDWSYTNEELHECATIWCPLSDVNKNNGTLFVIKGSHRFFKTYRSGSLPTTRIAAIDGLEKHLTVIQVNAGDSIIFHPALFHGSCSNQTDNLRVITAVLILPENTPLSYFHSDTSREVCQYYLTEYDFFENIKTLSAGSAPDNTKLKTIKYNHQLPSLTMLLEKINECASEKLIEETK